MSVATKFVNAYAAPIEAKHRVRSVVGFGIHVWKVSGSDWRKSTCALAAVELHVMLADYEPSGEYMNT